MRLALNIATADLDRKAMVRAKHSGESPAGLVQTSVASSTSDFLEKSVYLLPPPVLKSISAERLEAALDRLAAPPSPEKMSRLGLRRLQTRRIAASASAPNIPTVGP